MKKWKLTLGMLLVVVVLVLGINFLVVSSERGEIKAELTSYSDVLTSDEIQSLQEIKPDCAIVLGASVKPDGQPSPMLRHRLDAAVALYKNSVVPKVLLTGDFGQTEYNELKTMYQYVTKAGVPSEDVFCDYAGFSTYESVYRAKYVFEVNRAIVVTQKYHLYRALYGCDKIGIKAYGIASNQNTYWGQSKREVREILARDKDFIKWIYKPEPKYLGDKIPIDGSGDKTRE